MKRLIRRIVLVIVLLLAVAGGGAWWLSRSAPPWYQPPPPDDPQVARLADRVEYRVIEEAQKIRPPAENTWAVRVREEQVNAWLAARLRQWVAHDHGLDWPRMLGTPQVNLTVEGVSLAIPVGAEAVEGARPGRVIVAAFTPSITPDGRLTIPVRHVAMGRLALPGDPVQALLSILGEVRGNGDADDAPAGQGEAGADARPSRDATANDVRTDDMVAVITAALTGETPIDPVFDLADGRRIRILRLETGDGFIDVTNRTLGPGGTTGGGRTGGPGGSSRR